MVDGAEERRTRDLPTHDRMNVMSQEVLIHSLTKAREFVVAYSTNHNLSTRCCFTITSPYEVTHLNCQHESRVVSTAAISHAYVDNPKPSTNLWDLRVLHRRETSLRVVALRYVYYERGV